MTPEELERVGDIINQIRSDIKEEEFAIELLDDTIVSMFTVEHAFEKGLKLISQPF